MLEKADLIAYRKMLLKHIGLPMIEALHGRGMIQLDTYMHDIDGVCYYCAGGAIASCWQFNDEGLTLERVHGWYPVFGDTFGLDALRYFFALDRQQVSQLFGVNRDGESISDRIAALAEFADSPTIQAVA